VAKRSKPVAPTPPPPETERRKGGRPPYEPTKTHRDSVQTMTAYGIPQEEIAAVLGISHVTLRKYYAREIATGATLANSKVAEALYLSATGDGPQKVTAQIFWLKTRARWKEPPKEVSGPGGGPIATANVDLRNLTDEQLTALESIFSALAGEPGGDDGGTESGEGEEGA
jgi:hypothetical protein